jgi:hypothetical protein
MQADYVKELQNHIAKRELRAFLTHLSHRVIATAGHGSFGGVSVLIHKSIPALSDAFASSNDTTGYAQVLQMSSRLVFLIQLAASSAASAAVLRCKEALRALEGWKNRFVNSNTGRPGVAGEEGAVRGQGGLARKESGGELDDLVWVVDVEVRFEDVHL